jgi:VanZ family protein
MTGRDRYPTTTAAPIADDVVLRSAGVLRWLIMAALPFAVLSTIVLSLSDRVPRLIESVAVRAGVPVRLRDGVAGIDPFTGLHFVGWGALAFAVVVAVGRMRWAPVVAAVLISASIVIEVVQQTSTAVRGYQLSDVVANSVGVVGGTSLALMVLAATDWRRRSLRTAP